MAGRDQFGTGRRTAPALPADHRTKRFARNRIPYGDGFALVGNCDAENVDGRTGLKTGGNGFLYGFPHAHRVLLDPAGLWMFYPNRGTIHATGFRRRWRQAQPLNSWCPGRWQGWRSSWRLRKAGIEGAAREVRPRPARTLNPTSGCAVRLACNQRNRRFRDGRGGHAEFVEQELG